MEKIAYDLGLKLSQKLTLLYYFRSAKSKVKLNFGLSPDFSVQLKVSLSERLSKRLSQKLK